MTGKCADYVKYLHDKDYAVSCRELLGWDLIPITFQKQKWKNGKNSQKVIMNKKNLPHTIPENCRTVITCCHRHSWRKRPIFTNIGSNGKPKNGRVTVTKILIRLQMVIPTNCKHPNKCCTNCAITT